MRFEDGCSEHWRPQAPHAHGSVWASGRDQGQAGQLGGPGLILLGRSVTGNEMRGGVWGRGDWPSGSRKVLSRLSLFSLIAPAFPRPSQVSSIGLSTMGSTDPATSSRGQTTGPWPERTGGRPARPWAQRAPCPFSRRRWLTPCSPPRPSGRTPKEIEREEGGESGWACPGGSYRPAVIQHVVGGHTPDAVGPTSPRPARFPIPQELHGVP